MEIEMGNGIGECAEILISIEIQESEIFDEYKSEKQMCDLWGLLNELPDIVLNRHPLENAFSETGIFLDRFLLQFRCLQIFNNILRHLPAILLSILIFQCHDYGEVVIIL